MSVHSLCLGRREWEWQNHSCQAPNWRAGASGWIQECSQVVAEIEHFLFACLPPCSHSVCTSGSNRDRALFVCLLAYFLCAWCFTMFVWDGHKGLRYYDCAIRK